MNVVYEPKGRAREYSPLALNLYKGCDHLCKYCYVKTLINEHQFESVEQRKDLLLNLEKDCKNNNIVDQVLLSFTGDAYCHYDVKAGLTREALKILLKYQIPTAILTKGGKRCLRDLDLFKRFDNIKVGATIVFDNDLHGLNYESGAAKYLDRCESLWTLHNEGIKTFVSLEPVFSMNQTLNIIKNTSDYVDMYKVGKLNNYQSKKEVDWKLFLNESVKLLQSLKKDFYIKKDLAVFDKELIKTLDKKHIDSDYWALKKQEVKTLF